MKTRKREAARCVLFNNKKITVRCSREKRSWSKYDSWRKKASAMSGVYWKTKNWI